MKSMTAFVTKSKIIVVAEAAQSYEGSVEVAMETGRKVCRAGADAVMFQVVYADELVVPGYKKFDLFRSLELPEPDWKQIVKIIHDADRLSLGEVFGKRSADVALNADMDGFKIHVTDLNNLPLLQYIGKTNLPILLSVGGALQGEIQTAIKTLEESGTCEIILMHGYQLFPTDLQDTHIFKISALQEKFGLPVGYADHIAGCMAGDISRMNPLALTVPLLALGAGVKVIEKHVILDRTRTWEDCESALTPEEFSLFVNLVHEMETALGEKNLEPNNAERVYGRAKKSVVAACDIDVGTVLDAKHITLKRVNSPEKGFVSMAMVIGKVLCCAVKKDNAIERDNLTERK